jgi:hypothetical protein
MHSSATDFRWGLGRRLEFIEFRLFWEGGVNRSDIVNAFGVSVPQASKDLALYQEQAPGNIQYDRSLKRYFGSTSFRPKFITIDSAGYLEQLNARTISGVSADSWVSSNPSAEKLPLPQRRVLPDVLRILLECIRGEKSIEILYQSMSASRPDPKWRRISPHSFGNDGLRWHVRAYCHIDKKFKDFILSRCLDTKSPDAPEAVASDDKYWIRYFSVRLCPNPRLTASQREIIAQDFAMKNGEALVRVRCALLYHFNKRLRLDVADRFDNPGEAPVIVKNRDEFDGALLEAMR